MFSWNYIRNEVNLRKILVEVTEQLWRKKSKARRHNLKVIFMYLDSLLRNSKLWNETKSTSVNPIHLVKLDEDEAWNMEETRSKVLVLSLNMEEENGIKIHFFSRFPVLWVSEIFMKNLVKKLLSICTISFSSNCAFFL